MVNPRSTALALSIQRSNLSFPPWAATSDTLTQRDLGGKRTTFKVLNPKPRIRGPEPTTPPPTTAELATTTKPDVVPPTWLAPNDQWKSIFDKIATEKPTIKSDAFLATSPSATSKRFLEKTRAFDISAAEPSPSTPIEVAEELFQLAPPVDPATLVKFPRRSVSARLHRAPHRSPLVSMLTSRARTRLWKS
jgi:hypothetical protein